MLSISFTPLPKRLNLKLLEPSKLDTYVTNLNFVRLQLSLSPVTRPFIVSVITKLAAAHSAKIWFLFCDQTIDSDHPTGS